MSESIIEEYSTKIKAAQELPHPRVMVNICSHGNETIGFDIQSMCQNLYIKNGSLIFNIGNPEAVKTGKRFIDSDLNRSFPGKIDGTHEEQIAFQMMRYIALFDYVIDIHSTVSGMENCLIVEDDSAEIQQMISVCNNCDTVLHMTATTGSSIFTACRQQKPVIPGLAFEYGDNSTTTMERTYEDLLNVFSVIGLTESKVINKSFKIPTQFDCYQVLAKEIGDIPLASIKNYELVKKGDIVGHTKEGVPISAAADFYPVLFGETNYTTIFGFMAKKI